MNDSSRGNKSLQGRMMRALGLSILLTWIVSLAVLFVLTVQSHLSIEDHELKAIAKIILSSIPSNEQFTALGPRLQVREDFVSYEELSFQVWQGKQWLIGGAPDAPSTPFRPDFVEGFAEVTIDGRNWRVLSMSDRSGKVHVQVGRPRTAMNEHLRAEVFSTLSVATLLLAFTGFFMAYAVRNALKPIVASARHVRSRKKFDLTPLPASGLPSEVVPLVESFNQLLGQLNQAVESERRFIGDAAHELRTPLSALYGQAEVALRATTMAEKDAALVKLLTVAERSTRLSEQLLDLARLEAGTHAPKRESYNLDEIVVYIASEFDVAARKTNRTIQLVTEPCLIRCDVDEIGILLRNLVDNALRYTSPGGHVRISCGYSPESEHTVFLEVADDGPGVPPEQQAKIFDRFHRVPGTGPRGSGIGLSLVAEIARLHDATIETGNGIGEPGFKVRIVFLAASGG